MGAGRCPEPAHRGATIVAGGGAPIAAVQIQHPAAGHRLQRKRHQGAGTAEGVQVHQFEALAALERSVPLAREDGRIGTPNHFAHAVEYLLSPAAAFVTGTVMNLSGGVVLD